MKKKFILWTAILPLFFFLAANRAGGQTNVEYIGTDTCLECHDTVIHSLEKTPHAQVSSTKGSVSVGSCESCHGPGSIHMEDPEVKGSIRSFNLTSNEETAAVCLSCHGNSTRFQDFRNEKHYLTGESCTACHTLHQNQPRGKLLSDTPEKLCFQCHQEKEAAFALPYHHKVKEGRMTCWSCHDPHNTEVSSQRIGPQAIYQRCVSCHPSQKGPFTYEHLSVNTGRCGVCHRPHGSENARLLKRTNQYLLCIECHSGPSLSAQLLGPKTPRFHITSKSTYQNCTICHTRIHGSYLDKHFLR